MQNGYKALLSIVSAGYGILVKMPIPLEQTGIFWSNCAYVFIFTLSRHCKICDTASTSISQTSRGPLVKILLSLEPHGIFYKNFANL